MLAFCLLARAEAEEARPKLAHIALQRPLLADVLKEPPFWSLSRESAEAGAAPAGLGASVAEGGHGLQSGDRRSNSSQIKAVPLRTIAQLISRPDGAQQIAVTLL